MLKMCRRPTVFVIGRPGFALVALVMVAPLAFAGQGASIESDLVLDVTTAWAGEWNVTSLGRGAFNLSAGRDADHPIVLSSASFSGYHMDKPRAGTTAGPGIMQALDGTQTPLSGEGEISILCKVKCEVFLVATPTSRFSLTGLATGPLAPDDLPATYTAWSSSPQMPENFYHEIPAKDLAFGGGALADATAEASGDLDLFVMNATVTLHANGEVSTWELGREYRETRLAPVGPTVIRVNDRFMVLRLVGTAYLASDSDAVLHASPSDATFQGEVLSRSASGSMTTDGETRAFDGERLMLQGAFSFRRLGAETSEDILGSAQRTGIAAAFDGTATRVRIGTQEAVQPPVLPPAAQVSLVFLLLGLLSALALLPLYSRLDRARVLANPTRARILEALRAAPGLHATEIARRLGIARAVALHHLTMLAAHRFVTSRRAGWATHYYLPDAADAGAIAKTMVLADVTRRRVALEVARGLATQAQLVEATGISQRLVSYHLSKLERAGLVQVEQGRPRRFMPTQPLLLGLDGRAPSEASRAEV